MAFSCSWSSMKIGLIGFTCLTLTGVGGPGTTFAASLKDAIAYYKQGAFDDAAPILEKLSKNGDPDASFWLGSMWHQGRGKPVNYRTAHGLYRKAAYHGNADAQNNLGLLYRDGEGVEKNHVISYAWFSLSAAQKNPVAKRNLERLSARLSESEILEGQQLAAEYLEWIKKTVKARHAAKPATTIGAAPRDLDQTRAHSAGQPQSAKLPSTPHPVSTGANEHYLVQLGLFRNPAGVKRLEKRLERRGIRFVNQPISIRGTDYHRIRVGPFEDLNRARRTARRINKLFSLKSAVIPMPS